jgi:heme/copper-type cytochrome/quinol oxidase subunit 4
MFLKQKEPGRNRWPLLFMAAFIIIVVIVGLITVL